MGQTLPLQVCGSASVRSPTAVARASWPQSRVVAITARNLSLARMTLGQGCPAGHCSSRTGPGQALRCAFVPVNAVGQIPQRVHGAHQQVEARVVIGVDEQVPRNACGGCPPAR